MLIRLHFYRPQTKFAKVIFLHLSVSHFVHRGGGVPGQVPPWIRYTPLGPGTPPGTRYKPPRTRYTPRPGTSPHPPPPEQCMLGDTGNKRAVRILLFVKMLTWCLSGCCINEENRYRTHFLCLCLCQIVYGNTVLQFDTNTNVAASVNEA